MVIRKEFKLLVLFTMMFTMSLLFSGCGGPIEPPTIGCTDDDDCEDGEICVAEDCVPDTTTQQFSVTATVNPIESGSVTGVGMYNVGDDVTITATPNTGFEFVDWSEIADETSTEPTLTFTMPEENIAFIANFEELIKIIFTGPSGKNIFIDDYLFDNLILDARRGIHYFEEGEQIQLTGEITNDSYKIVSWRVFNGSETLKYEHEAELEITSDLRMILPTIGCIDHTACVMNHICTESNACIFNLSIAEGTFKEFLNVFESHNVDIDLYNVDYQGPEYFSFKLNTSNNIHAGLINDVELDLTRIEFLKLIIQDNHLNIDVIQDKILFINSEEEFTLYFWFVEDTDKVVVLVGELYLDNNIYEDLLLELEEIKSTDEDFMEIVKLVLEANTQEQAVEILAEEGYVIDPDELEESFVLPNFEE